MYRGEKNVRQSVSFHRALNIFQDDFVICVGVIFHIAWIVLSALIGHNHFYNIIAFNTTVLKEEKQQKLGWGGEASNIAAKK